MSPIHLAPLNDINQIFILFSSGVHGYRKQPSHAKCNRTLWCHRRYMTYFALDVFTNNLKLWLIKLCNQLSIILTKLLCYNDWVDRVPCISSAAVKFLLWQEVTWCVTNIHWKNETLFWLLQQLLLGIKNYIFIQAYTLRALCVTDTAIDSVIWWCTVFYSFIFAYDNSNISINRQETKSNYTVHE